MSEPPVDPKRVRVHHLAAMKAAGQPVTMLTSYDAMTAALFDAAGTDVLLVGDSYGTVVLGQRTTVAVTLDELLPAVRAVAGAVTRALVVADLPFGTYGASVEQGLASAVRLMKEGEAHAVKLEGGPSASPVVVPTVAALVGTGIPVLGHLGFTPQSEHALGGYRVQGRAERADVLVADALALQGAGACAVVLEMVPAAAADRVSAALEIPTIGIGAGAGCDGQVLVWQDMAGLTQRAPRLARAFADLRGALTSAAREYGAAVRERSFPGPEHTYPDSP